MSLENCLFCKIIKKEIPSSIILETKDYFVFKDINPIAPIHCLIVPKKHVENVNDAQEDDKELLGEIFFVAKELAKKLDVLESSFRLVFNTNELAGQTVFHLHCHFLANREFHWPPG